SRRAAEPNLTAEQAREFAADGESETGAAVLAAHAAVGLLERLENDLLLVGRNTDSGIADRERQHARRPIQVVIVRAPSAVNRLEAQRHLPALGELECVGEQIFDDLLQPLRI